jgi:diadenosine tetraphosphate (Ap4A) HIT family hydrolase
MYFPMPDGDPCFFCEIANGNAHQWQVIEAGEMTMTLLNGHQFEVGRCAIIPRRHVPTLLDLKTTGSGQEVPHFHMHVVPRQAHSDWGFGPPHLDRLEKEGRLRHHDHLVVTDEKLRTVETIRWHL